MTTAYETRLIFLAKEIIKMREEFDLLPDQEKEYQRKFVEAKARDKIEHLLGYILALDSHE